ncbi:MAG: OsmC family protein [Burkholderiales bacterium]
MQVKIKAKTYGPLRVNVGADNSIWCESEAGNRVRLGPVPAADALSPSDLILASLANCIAISVRMAAGQMALELGTLDLSAIAIKATDLPNRFGRFEVGIKTGAAISADKADELLSRTKEICTISNTLGAEIALQLN